LVVPGDNKPYMNAYLPLAVAIGVPFLILMVLRINATLVFLSLCLGNLLVQFVGNDAHSVMALASKAGTTSPGQTYVKLGLLLLPVVLTALFMIKSVKGPKLVWNALPAIAFGLVFTLLLVPLLPAHDAHMLTSSTAWGQFLRLQTLIVGSGTLICLLFLWMQRPKHSKEDKHSKHH
jgi:hypothetical protein